jgi:uncharacterized membrane protein YqiK
LVLLAVPEGGCEVWRETSTVMTRFVTRLRGKAEGEALRQMIETFCAAVTAIGDSQ